MSFSQSSSASISSAAAAQLSAEIERKIEVKAEQKAGEKINAKNYSHSGDSKKSEESTEDYFQRILLSTTLLPPRSVTIGEKLGEGAFGQVFRGTWGDKPVALKEIALEHARASFIDDETGFPLLSDTELLQSFEWEIARLSAVSHPNLVNYYGLYQQDDRCFITMELCAGGTLRDALGGTAKKPKTKRPLTQAQRWQIALELAQGLAYLHEQGILHRDLKAANVLLDAEGHAKLADLGVAQVDALMQRETAEVTEQGLSDKRFNAPEELEAGVSSAASTPSSDIFAYGLILWELFTGQEPENLSYEEVTQRLAEHRHEREPIPTDEKECPTKFAELMRACWHPDPKQRPKAKVVVNQLTAMAEQLHPQPAVVLAQQCSQLLLQEYRPALAYYVPSFSVPYVLDEDPDNFWYAREQAKVRAIAEAKEQQEQRVRELEKMVTAAALPLTPFSLSVLPSVFYLLNTPMKASTAKEAKQEILDEDTVEVKDVKESTKTAEPIDPLQPIDTVLERFMADAKARVLVIFGDAGLGKSSAAYQLALNYVQQANPSCLPLLLRSGLPEWRHGALSDGLNRAIASATYGLTPEQQTALKTQPVLWIVDGYDELQNDTAPQNLPEQLGLSQWSNAKLLISCRRNTVAHAEQIQRFGHGEQAQWQSASLLPLNQTQLLNYIQRRLGWSIAQRDAFASTLDSNPTLGTLMSNPFVLELSVNIWSELKDQPLAELTRFDIYQRSIAHYLEQQAQLLPEPIRRCLQSDHPSLNSSFMAMAESLADYGHARDQAVIPLHEALSHLNNRQGAWLELPKLVSHYARHEYRERQQQLDEKQRHRAILSQSDYMRLRRQQAEQFLRHSPFKSHQQRQAHDYRHRSLYEYCIAHGIVNALKTGQMQRLWQYLHYRLIQNEPLVMAFLRAAYHGQTITEQRAWQQQLQNVIRASAQSTLPRGWKGAPWHWSANAVSLLVDWHVSLTHQAWSGIQAPNAILSYACLAHSDLSHTNLRGAILVHTTLYKVNFTSADLRDVRWGKPRILKPNEYPFIEEVAAVAYHPREPWVAVLVVPSGVAGLHSDRCRSDDEILLIHTQNGKRLGSVIVEHGLLSSNGKLEKIAFTPDGAMLASACKDNTIRLWDMSRWEAKGEPLVMEGHTGAVVTIAFSPDGTVLASGSEDRTVRLWDAVTRKPIGKPLVGHTDTVSAIAFSPDGAVLASGSGDCTVRLWDVASQKAIGKPLACHTPWVTRKYFTVVNWMTLALWNDDKRMRLWDMVRVGHTGEVIAIAFSPDGSTLASSSLNGTIRLWDMSRWEAKGEPLVGHYNTVTSVAFSPDGRMLASGDRCGAVLLWDTERGEATEKSLVGHTQVVTSIAFSGDGETLASGSSDKTVRLWDVNRGETKGKPLARHTGAVTSVALSADGTVIVSGSRDGTVRLWDVSRGEAKGESLAGHARAVTSVAFSPDGATLASASEDRTLQLWSLSHGGAKGELLAGHTRTVTSVAFSPDGATLASGSGDKTIRLWGVASGQMIGKPLAKHTDAVTSIAFSPDGTTLASGSDDKTVRLWDVGRGALIGQPFGHKRGVIGVTFNPSGSLLVSIIQNSKEVCLWDIRSGRRMGTVQWHVEIRSIASARVTAKHKPSPEEWCLALGDELGAISFWGVKAYYGLRLLGIPAHRSMPILPQDVSWAHCQLDTLSRRLLTQQGAELEECFFDQGSAEDEQRGRVSSAETSVSVSTSSTSSSSSSSSSASRSLAVVEAQATTAVAKSSATSFAGITSRSRLIEVKEHKEIQLTEHPLAQTKSNPDPQTPDSSSRREVHTVFRRFAVTDETPISVTELAESRQPIESAQQHYTTVELREVKKSVRAPAVSPLTTAEQAEQKAHQALLQQAKAMLQPHNRDRYLPVLSKYEQTCAAEPLIPVKLAALNKLIVQLKKDHPVLDGSEVREIKESKTTVFSSSASHSSSSSSTSASATEVKFSTAAATTSTMGLFGRSSFSATITSSSAIMTMEAKRARDTALPDELEQDAEENWDFSDPQAVRIYQLTEDPAKVRAALAQRDADMTWLDALEKQLDDSLDFHDPEQLLLCLRHTDAIEAARKHRQTAPLTSAQRTALTAIERECKERLARKAAASPVLPPSP